MRPLTRGMRTAPCEPTPTSTPSSRNRASSRPSGSDTAEKMIAPEPSAMTAHMNGPAGFLLSSTAPPELSLLLCFGRRGADSRAPRTGREAPVKSFDCEVFQALTGEAGQPFVGAQ